MNVYYKGQPWEYDDRSPVLPLLKTLLKADYSIKNISLIEYVMIDLDLSKAKINSV